MPATKSQPPTLTGYLRTVHPEEVPEDLTAHVLDVADRAIALLSLRAQVEIIFFTACPPDHPDAEEDPHQRAGLNGCCVRSRPGHVYLRHGRTPDETERTLVHELRHEWQRANLEGSFSRDAIEVDAYRFADAWMGGWL